MSRNKHFRRDPNSLLSRSLLEESTEAMRASLLHSHPPSGGYEDYTETRMKAQSSVIPSPPPGGGKFYGGLLPVRELVTWDPEDPSYAVNTMRCLDHCFPHCSVCECRLWGKDQEDEVDICWACRNNKWPHSTVCYVVAKWWAHVAATVWKTWDKGLFVRSAIGELRVAAAADPSYKESSTRNANCAHCALGCYSNRINTSYTSMDEEDIRLSFDQISDSIERLSKKVFRGLNANNFLGHYGEAKVTYEPGLVRVYINGFMISSFNGGNFHSFYLQTTQAILDQGRVSNRTWTTQ